VAIIEHKHGIAFENPSVAFILEAFPNLSIEANNLIDIETRTENTDTANILTACNYSDDQESSRSVTFRLDFRRSLVSGLGPSPRRTAGRVSTVSVT